MIQDITQTYEYRSIYIRMVFRKWKCQVLKTQRNTDAKKVSKRRIERKAPQPGLKATKPERSSLPLLHIRILIFMRLPVFSPSVFSPQTIWTWKTWKAQIPGVAYHSLTWSHTADTNHDRLTVQSRRELLSSGDPGGFFYSVTPPAHAICLLLKSELQDVLPACALFLGGLHNQGPASCKL